jgi:choline dehydrogenase
MLIHEQDNADIIIVGAGTAGCVLAARLSEDPNLRVLIVEAGPMDRNPWIHIPVGFSRLLHHKRLNWCYETVAQASLGGRQIFWPRGKTVGGSGAINGMIWVRGAPEDYNCWAEQTGDKRWSWEGVQGDFKTCEAAPSNADERLGREGSVVLAPPKPLNDLAKAFIEAGENIGLPVRSDLAISDSIGIGEYLTTVHNGVRVSAATAYLKPVLGRKNLTLMTDSLVASVELDKDKTATGIRIRHKSKDRLFGAKQGVVMSGGAINSPQLLMLSGIGDGGHLRANGIETVVHLAGVGRNLQDHYGTRMIARISEPITVNDDFRRPWRLVKHGLNYAFRRRGPMTIGGAVAGAYLSTEMENKTPDIQIHFLPLSSRGKGWSFHSFSGVTANVCQLRPRSRGHIALRSSDPESPPDINPNYLSHVWDQKTHVEGLRLTRKLFEAAPFSTRFSAREEMPGPDCMNDEELLDYARANGSTVFHPVGTCSMGQDKNAVVDTEFRVRGTNKLWVADASVIPNIPSGNTNAAVMMLAEKASVSLCGDLKNERQ